MTLAGWLARLAIRRRFAVLAGGLAIVVAGGVLGAGLELQTDLAELLPSGAPSVVALRELSARVGGTGNVAIAIESLDGTPGPLRAYVPRLARAIREQLGRRVISLRYARSDVEEFYRRFAAYYVPLARLEAWEQRAARAIAMRENPLYVTLDDDDELATLAADLRTERARLEPSNAADPESGLFMTEHGKLAVIFVRPAADSLDLGGSEALLAEIRGIAAGTDPAGAHVRIAGYTGSIPNAISEVAAVRHDIASSALEVILAVAAAIMLYFRSARVLVALGAPLALGAAVALGFARLAIGHLNAQTAFLGAIIVGTGINYGIILVDRFQRTEGDLELAIAQTLRATAVAALATAVSFGVLAAGRVESFRQFGWIGGVGILACWIATFVVVPAVLVVFPPRIPRRGGFRPLATLAAAIGRACERFPRTILTAAACFTLAGIALAYTVRDHALETDMRALATRSSAIDGIEKLDNRLRAMDDRSSTPAVIATHDRSEARPICDQLNRRAHSDLAGIVVRCYSIEDLFPPDLPARARVLDRLRLSLARIDLDDIAATDRTDLADLQRALAERPPSDADLPPELAEYFTERDGSLGKLVYVDPVDEHFEANLYKLTDAIRSIHLPSGTTLESSGELVVFADVLRAVRRDSRVLTVAAALLVLVVLAAVTRRLAPFLRVSAALVAGVAVMLGFAVLTGQKLNFFNFVALPTTFGIGIDYAINIEERLRQASTRSVSAALAEIGPAVLLASLTSCFGYGSLLGADSGALVSFGKLAIVGELACVLLAITIVPAAVAAARRRR
ncbi:MAG: MMPL family transporter [Deltaproteobacteria bacterium]